MPRAWGRVWGVEPMEERALDQLQIRELSLRKHDLLTVARTAEAAQKLARMRHPSLTPDPERIYHRDDPRWRDQWAQAREAAWRRRLEHVEPIWCVVANVVRERPHGPCGVEVRWGTKHFRGGSRVHVIDAYYGACYDVVVIGRRRRSLKWTCVTMPAARLEGFRAKLAYDPAVIDGCLTSLGRIGMDQDEAEGAVGWFAKWAAEAEARRETLRAGRALLPSRFAPEFPHLDALRAHAVDVRLQDGTTRLHVAMVGPYFDAAIDFDPEQIVDLVRCEVLDGDEIE